MLDPDIIARARAVDILSVATHYGARLRKAGGGEFVGPCPRCGGRDRFAVNVRKNIWNCRGCSKGSDVIALVQHLSGGNFAEAVARLTGESLPVSEPVSASPPQRRERDSAAAEKQHDKARWLWSQRRPIQGTIAETYLQGRGITCPLPPTLAFLPPNKPEQHPAMIAAFGLPDEPEPGILAPPRNVTAVHLTLLKPDGSGKADVKPNKLFVGSPGNLPIVLAPPNDLLGMAIAEGIEDALSAHQVNGYGAWAAGAAGRMPALAQTLPWYIECVTIYAHDDNGRRHAHELARNIVAIGNAEARIEGLP